MKIVLFGYGTLNKIVEKLITENEKYELVAVVDFKGSLNNHKLKLEDITTDFDVIIDFSNTNRINTLLDYLENNPTKVVIATTNLSDEQLNKIQLLSTQMPIFQSYNTSYGVYVTSQLLKLASELVNEEYDVALLDIHHNRKQDSPSGTAKVFEQDINNNNLQIQSFRIGDIVGSHEITYTNNFEQITIKHEALNREIFADGALRAANELLTQDKGLYNLQNLYNKEIK